MKRISYAASIGIENLTSKEQRDYKKWLGNYDAISVREESARCLLMKLTGREIAKVADPTFLLELDYWKAMAVKPIQENYILLFTLSYEVSLVEYGKRLAKESGKRLVVLNQKQPEPNHEEYIAVMDAGPQEFLGYIAYADMVITDSFHCTVFSILLGARNFYTYISPWNRRGSRIIELLHTYQLDNHLLDQKLCQSMLQLESNAIDRNTIIQTIIREQALARHFLLENIQS